MIVPATPRVDDGRANHAAFRKDPVAFLRARAAEGDVSPFRLGRQRYVLLAHPDGIHAVLETHSAAFAKRRGKQLLGEGLLTSDGAHHAKQRKLMTPAFHGKQVSTYGEGVAAETLAFTAHWEPGLVLDMDHEMPALLLRIVGRMLFGAEIDPHGPAIVKALDTLLGLSSRITHPWAWLLNVLPLPENLAALAAKSRLDAIVYGLIRGRRAIGAGDQDLLDMLLTTTLEDGQLAMDDRQIRDETLTLLLAGNETTSTALVWTWYLLGTHPEIEAQLHAELAAVVGAHEQPGIRHLAKLPWTRNIVTEAMRLYPPAWALWRNAQADVLLPEGRIEKGSVVVLSPAVTHLDPRFYPAPEVFDPTRWAGAGRSARPKYAYFPFGGGDRSCIGEPFAWVSLMLVLATIARQWKLVPQPNQDLTLEPLITLRPRHGLKVKLARR